MLRKHSVLCEIFKIAQTTLSPSRIKLFAKRSTSLLCYDTGNSLCGGESTFTKTSDSSFSYTYKPYSCKIAESSLININFFQFYRKTSNNTHPPHSVCELLCFFFPLTIIYILKTVFGKYIFYIENIFFILIVKRV